MRDYYKVADNDNLLRDPRSKGIVNVDSKGLTQAKRLQALAVQEQNEKQRLRHDLDSLRHDVDEIKTLLNKLVEKLT